MKRFTALLLAVTFCGILPSAAQSTSSTINSVNSYAYGANVGWITFRPSAADGVRVMEWYVQGRAYGANIGWIDLGDGTPGALWQYTNTAGDYGVNHDAAGNLSGYAYAANAGWINFGWTTAGDPNQPRVDFATGRFHGYAWSANLGWINLDAGGRLFTDSISRPDTDADGIGDVWEYAYAGNLTTLDATGDPDGDGQDNAAEYLAATSPFAVDQVLNPVLVGISDLSGFAAATIKWFGNGARHYTMEASTTMAPGSWIIQGSYYGGYVDIIGTYYSMSVEPRRFYRVKPLLPLP